MNDEEKDPRTVSSFLHRLYPWLIELWIAYVLFAFLLIRVLGSGTVQRLLTLVRLRLAP